MKRVTCSVVGDGAVGKTCLLIRYAKDEYDERYIPTIFDAYTMHVPVGSKTVDFRLKDTAGNESHDALRDEVCRDTDVFLMCYSTTSRTSFENIQQKWKRDITKISPSGKMVLVGTKCDLNGQREVQFAMGQRLATEWGIPFVECSAKTKMNVSDAFHAALKLVLIERKCTIL